MLLVSTYDDYNEALKFIQTTKGVLAYDIETTGLNTRKDKIIGFGVSNGLDGFYVPIWSWNAKLGTLEAVGIGADLYKNLIKALLSTQLIMFNASFDALFTKQYFGIDLLPALHTDVLLLKHTCDEDYPFGLKEIATKLWGTSVTEEKDAMQASTKANGGAPKEYYKADLQLLAKYCVMDCLLTYRVFTHYDKELGL